MRENCDKLRLEELEYKWIAHTVAWEKPEKQDYDLFINVLPSRVSYDMECITIRFSSTIYFKCSELSHIDIAC